ncbi:glutamine amidotransferase [Gracilibacillus halophilus YIM-C55.5]|uniref:Glutamine amidotransferase n=1 Tax=Gracilibacillus halophilus YIM-C55.5 TaxID=1308866 RepID=N4W712_9BACI|nr:gamma-glutamyl-gamma-aminobutyrate hydrolase family protein [Gracilibacillus halophilus]ENH96013.1 glutamine amidotransferase [Gracilibacillus halophilus YIM-C55.5]
MVSSNIPVIGITSTVVHHNQILSYHLHEKHIQAVKRAGGVPVIIPTGTDVMCDIWVRICDGIVLSSGEDIDPESFGAHPSPHIQKTSKKRDETEIQIVHHALQQKKPMLGICRGAMIVNVALGGTVIQDIETSHPNAINHQQQAARSEPTHHIQMDQDSRLFQLSTTSDIQVNSIHHQAVDQLAPQLKKVATAPDGVIEAIESVDPFSPMIIGVQWHPEEMASENPTMQKLFDTLVMESQSCS